MQTLPAPTSPAQPVTDVLHGVQVTDPYRWLEDSDSLYTRQWLSEQHAYARGYLESLPGRDGIKDRLSEFLFIEQVSRIWKLGNKHFYLRRAPEEEQPSILLWEEPSKQVTVLLNPLRLNNEAHVSLDILDISNDARFLAYLARASGEDYGSLGILDVDNHNAVLRDSLSKGFLGGLSFSSDSKSFYYIHRSLDSARPHLQAVYQHILGESIEEDAEIFWYCEDSSKRLFLLPDPDRLKLCYVGLTIGARQQLWDLYVHNIGEHAAPRLIAEEIEGTLFPFFADGQLFALTNLGAPNYKIVAVDIERADPSDWHTVVAETKYRIQQVSTAGHLLFVSYVADLASRIDIFDLDGNFLGELPCPKNGTVSLSAESPSSTTLFYRFSSFVQPPTTYKYDTSSGKQEIWAQAPPDGASEWITTTRASYQSKDGTFIPITLFDSKTTHTGEARPVFLTAYGGFGHSVTPQYSIFGRYLVDRGAIFAIANIRGGSEFGETWHEAAIRTKRQTAIDDFIAAAEWLIQNGLTTPGRLAIGGGSNAGLLVGASAIQRPDLFRAVICLGPLLDMLRYHLFDQARLWTGEFGSAEHYDDFIALHGYSPYHNVRDGVGYPAMMIISGDADTRCNPMHARKMTARLQQATNSGRPIVLDYKPGWGHMPVQPLTTRLSSLVDRLAFVCQEIGLSTQDG